MPAERQMLCFHGSRVSFTILRPASQMRRRLFLLSSALATSFHWRKLLPELSETGCLVVLADPPGFGESDLDGMNLPLETRAKILWGVLDDVDARFAAGMSTWHLIGHGSSCPLVLAMANLFPDSVRSQIHISPLFATGAKGRFGRGGKRAVQKLLDQSLLNAHAFSQFAERAAGKPLPDYVWEPMYRPLARPSAKAELFAFLTKETILRPNVGFCPAMAVWGGRDPILPPTARESVLSLLPDAETHIIKSAGHFPMETHSRALRDFLRGWLKYVEE